MCWWPCCHDITIRKFNDASTDPPTISWVREGQLLDTGDGVFIKADGSGNIYAVHSVATQDLLEKWTETGTYKVGLDTNVTIRALAADGSNLFVIRDDIGNPNKLEKRSTSDLTVSSSTNVAATNVVARDAVVDSSGNIIIAFNYDSTNNISIEKYNSSLSPQWAYDGVWNARAITTDGSDNIYAVGTVDTDGDTLVKLNSSGVKQWGADVGGSSETAEHVDWRGNNLCCTISSTSKDLLHKYTDGGSFTSKTLTGSGSLSSLNGCAFDDSGRILVVHDVVSSTTTRCYDTSLSEIWNRDHTDNVEGCVGTDKFFEICDWVAR